MPRNRLNGFGLWGSLWAGLLVISLYSRPPLPVDETRYLSVAWEMWQSNHFLVPHINGLPYTHKPPLLFWLIHFGWWLFGVNPLSARVTAPLFSLASILLTMRIGSMLWPGKKDIPRYIPFLLLGACIWSFYGTLTMFDMLIVFAALLAYRGMLQVIQGQKVLGWLTVSLACGLGILAKGPVILIFTLPPALLAPWWAGREAASWRHWYGGVLLSLAGAFLLALLWAVPASLAGGPEYSRAIFLNQTAGRVVNSFAHQRPLYWYVLFLPLILFPWIFWAPAWQACRHMRFERGTRFCLSIVVPAFLLLSLVSGKQLHYILPLLPGIALLTAKGLSGLDKDAPGFRWPVPAFLVLVGVILLVVPHLTIQGGDAEMLALLPPWLGLIPITAGLTLRMTMPAGTAGQLLPIASVHVLLLIFLQLALLKPLHELYDPAAVAAAIQKKQNDGYLVAVTPPRMKDQLQFTGRLTTPLIPVDNVEDMAAWSRLHPDQYCLIATEDTMPALLAGSGIMKRFNKGYLIFRPAVNFTTDMQQWQSKGS